MGRRCTAAQGGRAMTGATRRITMIVLVLAVCAGPWGCAVKRPPMLQSPSEDVGAPVYGAVTAESASKIDAAQAELKSAVMKPDIQMMLRDQVLQIVRDRGSLNFVAVDDQQGSANGERIDYQALASTGIDTVLEVSLLRLGLAGQSGINPPVSLFMTARARLIRTADGAEM